MLMGNHKKNVLYIFFLNPPNILIEGTQNNFIRITQSGSMMSSGYSPQFVSVMLKHYSVRPEGIDASLHGSSFTSSSQVSR